MPAGRCRGGPARTCSPHMAARAAAPPSGGAASPARGPAPRAPAPAASREAVRGAARGWHGGTRRGSAPAAAAGARRGPAGSNRRPHRVLQLRRQRGCLPRRAGLGGETGRGGGGGGGGAGFRHLPVVFLACRCRISPQWSSC